LLAYYYLLSLSTVLSLFLMLLLLASLAII
jgi:hypothetical protein